MDLLVEGIKFFIPWNILKLNTILLENRTTYRKRFTEYEKLRGHKEF